MTATVILVILALVCFLLATFGTDTKGIATQPLGLALLTIAWLLGHT
ncbi:MAG: hypothetical protein ABIR55_08850 [Burkholderiaceae bacterium]